MIVWIQNPFDNLPIEGFRKQRYWLMAEAFVRAGHRVVLWTTDFNHTTKKKRVVKEELEAGFEVREVPTMPYRKNVGLERVKSHREYAKAWEKTVEAEAARPDLIVTSIPTISAAEAALRIGRRCGAKVIVDVMDAWPETFERLAPHGFRWLAKIALGGLRRRARRLYREADCVTGVCARYRELTGREDYHQTYHGIEIEPERRDLPHAEPPRKGVRIVYAGNLGLTYDLGTAIRGLKGANATLDIAGKGQGEEVWKALVGELGLDSRVRFHGYLDAETLKTLLTASDVGLVPMPADSFVGVPYKFADYAASGLAILSSLGGESEDLLRAYGCGEGYAAGDPRSFALALEKLSGRLAEAKNSSRKMAEDAFDAVKIYDEFVTSVPERCRGFA